MILRKNELKEMSLNKINDKIKDLNMELIKTRAKVPDNPGKVREIKKTIARMLTEINQRGNG